MSSGELGGRERNVLFHLGRYRLSFKEVIGRLYFGGSDPQKTLDGLRSAGYIETGKGFQGNRSSYYLRRKGADLMQLSPRRADPLGSEALPTHLAIYSFCVLKGRPRIVLDRDELEELFDGSPPSGRYHCLERSKKRTCLYHVYVPGPTTRPDVVTDSTRAHVVETLDRPDLKRWFRYKLYVHAVLVETQERAGEIRRALDRMVLDEDRPLNKAAAVHVECVPMFAMLEEALGVLAKETQEA